MVLRRYPVRVGTKRDASALTCSAHSAKRSWSCRCISASKRLTASLNSSEPAMSISVSMDMCFHFSISFMPFFLCLSVYLVADDGELVDGPGGLVRMYGIKLLQ